jgi:hypothetical protein
MEGRTTIQHAFRPDSPPVPMNDALDIRQADAGARELVLAVQSLKHAE